MSKGKPHTEETKRKMSLAKMGHPVSEETRAKLSRAFEGRPSPFRGKHHSKETKAKISLNRMGKGMGPANYNYHRIFTQEERAKMSAAEKGRIMPESVKRKISESNKNSEKRKAATARNSAARIGKPLSPTHCANITLSRMGDKNPGWKGGRTIDSKGYVRIMQKDHPKGYRDGYVLEHRLVAEKALGRFLKTTEGVHHVNGIRDDNRNSNLVICQDGRYHTFIHARMRRLKKVAP